MMDILSARFMTETIRTAAEMYAHGWDERNAGNISVLLDAEELEGYLDTGRVIRKVPTGFACPGLDGRCFLVTGAGKYFRNVLHAPEACLGILRLTAGGTEAEILWGLDGGGSPTSEFASHMMSHVSRLGADPQNRVIMHCHPTNLLAMTFVHSLDEREFTRTLWRSCSECVIVFPDGVNVLPWMLCGTNEIDTATAEKMLSSRLCVWAQHGVYGAGRSLDEAFGLIETAEKAAEICLKTAHLPILNTIGDAQLRMLAERFGVTVREGYLDD